MSDLLACPWCGQKPKRNSHFAWCNGTHDTPHMHAQQPLALWNRRASPPAWQPIETAPKDGTGVLVFRPLAPTKRMIGIDGRRPNQFDGEWANSRPGEQPTHWQPLPPPPPEAGDE